MIRLGLLFWFAASVGQACSCMSPGPPCASFWTTEAVFRGKAIARIPIAEQETGGYYKVRFAVAESFRGAAAQELTVNTNQQGSACGIDFQEGREYVVYASAGRFGELWAGRCGLTHEYKSGDRDVAWLRGLASAPATASILGNVAAPAGVPVKVRLDGTAERETALEGGGAYTFDSLPPGVYTVSASAPAGFWVPPAKAVNVGAKACAVVYWPVQYDSHIRGRVTDGDGLPAAGLAVRLSRRDARYANGIGTVDLATTDAEGAYEFAKLPPGEYFVAANSLGPSKARPYPMVELPPLQLGASAVLDGVDVKLPRPWKPVTVHARVLLPDGSPAHGATVMAHDTEALWSSEPPHAVAAEDGTASLTVYEGRTYYLTAFVEGTTQRCAGPLAFVGKDGIALATITIAHDWGNCLAQLNPNFRR